jgi:threonine dehydrogenase-like Zn-dependent dehydrogenase
MKALCWNGVRKLNVENVPDPYVINPHDAIIKVTMSSTCGSDLHIINGLIPTMKHGDVLGHEFMGEVVEVGSEVKAIEKGDRVVVPSPISCGSCWFCQHGLHSCCDNSNPNAELQDKVLGYPVSAIYGYTHAFGGYAGSHAQYIRVPYADRDCFIVPDGLKDENVIFFSDAAPTGFMGADFCDIERDDVVAVWGCGGVGLMAIESAYLLGAERVIAIDRFPERLKIASEYAGAETLNYMEDNVLEALKEMTGGRGPDKCIEAVGMEAHGAGLSYVVDRAKQAMKLQTDRGQALREAILACRKGGIVAMLGVYGVMDLFPLGVIMNKALTLKSGQQHGHKYVPRLLEYAQAGQLDPSYLITHRFSLEDGARAYQIFNDKEEGCLRAVFTPN